MVDQAGRTIWIGAQQLQARSLGGNTRAVRLRQIGWFFQFNENVDAGGDNDIDYCNISAQEVLRQPDATSDSVPPKHPPIIERLSAATPLPLKISRFKIVCKTSLQNASKVAILPVMWY